VSILLIALVVAAVVCVGLWKRPDARAAVAGGWQAGKAQAAREFRDGYRYAQKQLLAGNPSWKQPRRWLSGLLSVAYGAAQTLVAANRVRRAAWQGARSSYAAWKASQQPVDGEVIEEIAVTKPTADSSPQPEQAASPQDETDPQASPSNASSTTPCGPDQGPEPDQEGTTVQTEAAGLTSYANAHAQFASELRTQMSGSESLAASMAGILAEHSDLIGDTAVLQDLLNQAAGVAQRIADRALTVANN